jgi:hypothetical protein
VHSVYLPRMKLVSSEMIVVQREWELSV